MPDLIRALLLLGLLAPLWACGPSTTERDGLPPLQSVAGLDVARYMGTWYEIASFPQRFQRGCTGTTATYSLREDGEVSVVNRCYLESLQGREKVAEGRARVVDVERQAWLEVSFFGPFWGDYWVIDLGEDYAYAVVGHPGRDYLWILSRRPQLDPAVYAGIVQRLARDHRYDVSRLQRTLQPGAEP